MKAGNAGGQTPQQPQVNVDLKSTKGVENSKGTNIWKSRVILRNFSKNNP